MKTFRLYTSPDGQSRIEPIDLAKLPEWTAIRHSTGRSTEGQIGRPPRCVILGLVWGPPLWVIPESA